MDNFPEVVEGGLAGWVAVVVGIGGTMEVEGLDGCCWWGSVSVEGLKGEPAMVVSMVVSMAAVDEKCRCLEEMEMWW